MDKKKLFARLGIFVIGLPLVLFIVFLKAHAHLPLHITICLVSCIASNELYTIISKKIKLLPRLFINILSVVIPLVAAIYEVVPTFTGYESAITSEVVTYTLIAAFLAILSAEVFSATTFSDSTLRIAACSFIVLYTGYLLTFISRMAVFSIGLRDISTPVLAIFLLMVFLCDSFAWFFGVLFGKNNKGFIKASPNKSLAGFIGGFIGSITAGLIGFFVWGDIFVGSPVKIFFMSILIAFASIVGDLAESIFKRSSGIKDSGSIVPGRGGILDSIDSILMAAPVYYLLFNLLYRPF